MAALGLYRVTIRLLVGKLIMVLRGVLLVRSIGFTVIGSVGRLRIDMCIVCFVAATVVTLLCAWVGAYVVTILREVWLDDGGGIRVTWVTRLASDSTMAYGLLVILRSSLIVVVVVLTKTA